MVLPAVETNGLPLVSYVAISFNTTFTDTLRKLVLCIVYVIRVICEL